MVYYSLFDKIITEEAPFKAKYFSKDESWINSVYSIFPKDKKRKKDYFLNLKNH